MSSAEKIDWCIACGPKADILVPYLIQTLKRTGNFEDFRFLLGITPFVDHCNLKYNLRDYKNITYIDCLKDHPTRDEYAVGSKSHSFTLDKLWDHVTSKWSIVSDCDLAFMTLNWHLLLISKNVSVIATKSISSNNMCPYFCFMKTNDIKSTGLSWTYPMEKVPENYHQDTGYQLQMKIDKCDLPSITMNYIVNNEIYTYYLGGIPIVTHIKKARYYSKEQILSCYIHILRGIV